MTPNNNTIPERPDPDQIVTVVLLTLIGLCLLAYVLIDGT